LLDKTESLFREMKAYWLIYQNLWKWRHSPRTRKISEHC